MKKQKDETFFEWMTTDRLYEKYFFFYFLIMAVFVIGGLSTLGFEVDGRTPVENWVFNVLWCFFVTFMICFTPFYYRLIFGKNANLLKKTAEVREQLNSITGVDERRKAEKELVHNGKLPPTQWQFAGMVFIAWYVLFEFCIASALVRDYQLVWEPQWLQSLIEWGIDNTKTPADYGITNSKKLTLFFIDFRIDDFSKSQSFIAMKFTNELEFLQSPVGHAVMTFALWRVIISIPVLIAFALVFAKMLGWLGLNGLNVLYAKGVVNFLGRVFLNLIILVFLVAAFFNIDLGNSAECIINKSAWGDGLAIRLMMFIFTLLPTLLIIGWFDLLAKQVIKLKNDFLNCGENNV